MDYQHPLDLDGPDFFNSLGIYDENYAGFSISPDIAGTIPGIPATTLLPNDVASSVPETSFLSGNPDWLTPQWNALRVEDMGLDSVFGDNGSWGGAMPQTTSTDRNLGSSRYNGVDLLRELGLAERERQKRSQANFEIARPVISNSHGVTEEAGPSTSSFNFTAGQSPVASVTTAPPVKKPRPRSARKTQVLKSWFACHTDHPYPSEREKISLARQSGLSREQVGNWFSNARRSHKISKARDKKTLRLGPPMPSLERWWHTSPEEEPFSTFLIDQDTRVAVEGKPKSRDVGAMYTGARELSSSGGSMLDTYSNLPHPYPSPGPAPSYMIHSSISNPSPLSYPVHFPGVQPPSNGAGTSYPSPARNRTFRCRFCSRSFAKKYDCQRHEKSIHLSGGDSRWVCAIPLPKGQPGVIWRAGQVGPECIFCGHRPPTEEHFKSHDFEACTAEHAGEQRSFNRKDHLWQHLRKFHKCRKWNGWNFDLDLLKRD
ncbi:hypothetical protein AAE478_004450 [Parahypoxylon ruwenzoriense]